MTDWPPKLEDIGPPDILCSRCGKTLERIYYPVGGDRFYCDPCDRLLP